MKMKNIWFVSDLHIGHRNVIFYCKRPFVKGDCCNDKNCSICRGYGFIPDVDLMNETLINNYNECVKPGDTVYMLGDICFQPRKKLMETLYRLNGNKHLIYGNHDKSLIQEIKKLESEGVKLPFVSHQDYKEINVEGQKIILMHYAMRTWNAQHKGAWQLYGHSHNNLPELPTLMSMDVGVDAHDYKPISFEQVKKHMTTKAKHAKKNNLTLTEDHHRKDVS